MDKWTQEEDRILQQFYHNHTKELLLIKLEKRTWNAICNRARLLNLKRQCTNLQGNLCGNQVRKDRKFNSLNVDFTNITDEKHSYILGYLAADGNIYRNKLGMVVAEQDYDFILLLKQWFNESSDLKYSKISAGKYQGIRYYGQYALNVHSKILVDQLSEKGIVPNKTKILKPPRGIPSKLRRHWVRGYFDGDGSFYLSKQGYICFNILGTEDILEYILKNFNEICEADFKIGWDRSTRQFGTCGNKALSFLDWIYTDCKYYLPRKYDKYTRLRSKVAFTKSNRWSNEEIDTLIQNYKNMTKGGLIKLLPQRSWCAICTKALKLGLKRK